MATKTSSPIPGSKAKRFTKRAPAPAPAAPQLPFFPRPTPPPGAGGGGGLVLTEGQIAALGHLLEAVADGENPSLIGAAGTGKTTLLDQLIRRLQGQGLRVMAAAPTHKACSVLRGKIPPGVEVATVASLLGLKPVHRGRRIEFVADWDHARKRQRLQGVGALVVDEASMVSQATAAMLTALAAETSTTVVFVGDAAQLPPVDPPPDPEPGEEEEEPQARGAMAQEFLNPAGGAAVLTEVVRHQGPVLALATAIRGCSDLEAINAVWPTETHSDEESTVWVCDYQSQWLDSACKVLADPRWPGDPDAGRIVCWTNRVAASLTAAVRNATYGAAAAEGWQVGEIVANGDAVQQPGQSLAKPLAPSSCEWRIEGVEVIQFEQVVATLPWRTPKARLPRELEISASLELQRLRLVPIAAGPLQGPIEVLCPRSGDRAWAERIAELKKGILAIPADQASTRKAGWKAWHGLRSYVADLRSAAVLTTHRAQGSTFRQVWIANDLSWSEGSDSVALHYTAITRTSKAVHLLRRG